MGVCVRTGRSAGKGNYCQDVFVREESIFLKDLSKINPFWKKREQDVKAAALGGEEVTALILLYCFVNFGRHPGFHSLKCKGNAK